MKPFLLFSIVGLSVSCGFMPLAFGEVETAKQNVDAKVLVQNEDAVQVKERLRSRIITKIDKYIGKLDNYLKARSQDDSYESVPGEDAKIVSDIQSRIDNLKQRKDKLLNKVNVKYNFSTPEEAKKTFEKVNLKLKAIKEKSFEGILSKQAD